MRERAHLNVTSEEEVSARMRKEPARKLSKQALARAEACFFKHARIYGSNVCSCTTAFGNLPASRRIGRLDISCPDKVSRAGDERNKQLYGRIVDFH